MVLRGQALPLRDYFLQRLPAVGSGRAHPVAIAVVVRDHRARHHRRSRRGGRTRSSRRSPWASSCSRSSSSPATPASSRSASSPSPASARWVAGRLVDAGGWPFWLALLAGVVGHGPARRAVRPPRRARPRHQPGHRHARPGHGDRADDLQQRRLRRRLRRHPGRQARRCSGWTSTPSATPAATPSSCMVVLRARGADGRQHAARALRAAAARRAHQRARRRGARHQRARRQGLRLRAVGRRSPRSAACCSPSARTSSSTTRVHELHVDPRRWRGVHRRHRLPVRPGHRRDAGPGLARRPAHERDLRQRHRSTSSSSAACSSILLVLQNQDGIAKESINQFAVDRSGRSGPRSRACPQREAARRSSCRPSERERVAPTHARGARPDRPLRRRRRRRRRVVHRDARAASSG